jgi:hypothetical protein
MNLCNSCAKIACFSSELISKTQTNKSPRVPTFILLTSLFTHPQKKKSNRGRWWRTNSVKRLYLGSQSKFDAYPYEPISSEWSILSANILTFSPRTSYVCMCVFFVAQQPQIGPRPYHFLRSVDHPLTHSLKQTHTHTHACMQTSLNEEFV